MERQAAEDTPVLSTRAYTTELRTERSFRAEVPALLLERRMSLRRLAQLTGVDVAHLSRVLRGKNGKRPTGELARRVADALELPAFYFPESRELAVREELARDPGLRERVFAEIDPRD